MACASVRRAVLVLAMLARVGLGRRVEVAGVAAADAFGAVGFATKPGDPCRGGWIGDLYQGSCGGEFKLKCYSKADPSQHADYGTLGTCSIAHQGRCVQARQGDESSGGCRGKTVCRRFEFGQPVFGTESFCVFPRNLADARLEFFDALEHVRPAAAGLKPNPKNFAQVARWLVYMSDIAVSGTMCSTVRSGCAHVGDPFSNGMAVSDGNETHSTGTIYTYLPDIDPTMQDLVASPTISLTFMETSLGQDGRCGDLTEQEPPCARLTIAGKMTKVPDAQKAEALSFMVAKHPEMAARRISHGFTLWHIAREDVTSFTFSDMRGPAHAITVEEYYASFPQHHAAGPRSSAAALKAPWWKRALQKIEKFALAVERDVEQAEEVVKEYGPTVVKGVENVTELVKFFEAV